MERVTTSWRSASNNREEPLCADTSHFAHLALPCDIMADHSSRLSLQVPRDPAGIIDMEILGQVFEMDELDDEDEDGEGGGHEFSKGIVWNYFEQANTTFDEMKEAL
jgi:hypothetical protein